MENQIARVHCPAEHRDKSVVSARLVDGVVCGAQSLPLGQRKYSPFVTADIGGLGDQLPTREGLTDRLWPRDVDGFTSQNHHGVDGHGQSAIPRSK
jgi:hypothetical protein